MSEEDALLAAIAAEPDEDTNRWVYADWLDENGEPERAEFIRVQCELARLGECDPVCSQEYGHRKDCSRGDRGEELRRREWELLQGFDGKDMNWLAWSGLKETGILLGRPWHERITFRRGFLDSVACTAADWLRHGDEIRRRHPVTRVVLTTDPGEFPVLTLHTTDGSQLFRVAGQTVRVAAGQSSQPSHLLAARWPGVAFELPTVSGPMADGSGRWTLRPGAGIDTAGYG